MLNLDLARGVVWSFVKSYDISLLAGQLRRYINNPARAHRLQPQVPLSFTDRASNLFNISSLPIMFSFAKIATFAALAFSTLASAIPSPAPVAAPEARELATRANQDITTILTNLNNDLKAPLGELSTSTLL